jgi:hypothetical protein
MFMGEPMFPKLILSNVAITCGFGVDTIALYQ